MEVELWNLRVKDSNISAYTQRFNELILLCPDSVPNEKKKVEAYIRGLPENIKGETTSSKPVVLNDVVRMAYTLMEQKLEDSLQTVIVVGCVILETVCQSAIGVEGMAIKQEIVDQGPWLLV
ncbi:putative reverse transcriptase domain-containing protein [Tanacetum coccineum]